MNKYLQSYLHSFHAGKEFLYHLLIDIITTGLIGSLLYIFNTILNAQMARVTGGKSVEQLRTALLAGSLEYNQAFASNFKVFVVLFICGLIIAILGVFIILGVSRAKIWSSFMKEQHQKLLWGKWSLLLFLLTLSAIPYLLLVALFRLLLNPLLSTVLLSQIFNAFFFLLFVLFMVLVKYSFVEKKKVWEAIGYSFFLIKHHFSALLKSFIFIILTSVILSFFFYLLEITLLKYQSELTLAFINLGFFLVLLAWIRRFLISVLERP